MMISLEIEVDGSPAVAAMRGTVVQLGIPGARPGLIGEMRISDEEPGHGFGLSEVLNVVVEIGSGATGAVLAEAILGAIHATIRRVRTIRGSSSGRQDDVANLLDRELENTQALSDPDSKE